MKAVKFMNNFKINIKNPLQVVKISKTHHIQIILEWWILFERKLNLNHTLLNNSPIKSVKHSTIEVNVYDIEFVNLALGFSSKLKQEVKLLWTTKITFSLESVRTEYKSIVRRCGVVEITPCEFHLIQPQTVKNFSRFFFSHQSKDS